jgi:hypothetical protein
MKQKLLTARAYQPVYITAEGILISFFARKKIKQGSLFLKSLV